MHKEDVVHDQGPFVGFRFGDVVRVIYQNAPTALMLITRVRRHAIEGLDGECKCRITIVSPTELRFYGELSPGRWSVLRGVKVRKIE